MQSSNGNFVADGSIASLNNASFSEYSFKFYDSDAEVEEASMHGNTIFDINNVLGVFDAEIYNPIDSILTMESNEGRVSLAYERLSHIPRPFAETFAATTHTLDLSHNNLKDLSFLTNFRKLSTLILDQNETPAEHTLPHLPQLRILWLNNCRINNPADWLRRLQTNCPQLRQLSLLGNPGCLSAFNGGSVLEHLDYRLFVIAALPHLEHLDDAPVTDTQRTQAALHRSSYATHGGPMTFVEKFATTARMPDLFAHRSSPSMASTAAANGSAAATANGTACSSSSAHRRDVALLTAGTRERGHKSTTSMMTDSSQS